jgi:hypothetical protein
MARTGRPPLSIGTAGEIGYTETRDKKGRLRVHAHALYRGSAGHTQRVKRVGQSEREARDRLKVALARMQAHTEEEGIGPHTTIRALAAAWMAEPHPWRPNTREQYVRVIDNHIIPKMGGVRLSEVRASAVSRLLTQLRNGPGAGPALQAKKALSGMFRLAVVNDAMTANPALGTVSIPQPRSTVRALTRTEEDCRILCAMITRAPGWYTDEADGTVERYWNGSTWQDEARAAQGAPTAAATPAPWYVQSGQSSKLSDTGNLLVAVAVLVAVAAVVVGGF